MDKKRNGIAKPGVANGIVADVGADDTGRAVLSDRGCDTIQSVLCEFEDGGRRSGCNLLNRLLWSRKRNMCRMNPLGLKTSWQTHSVAWRAYSIAWRAYSVHLLADAFRCLACAYSIAWRA